MRFIDYTRYNRINSVYYLDKVINECKILINNVGFILENDDYHIEWDLKNGTVDDRINNIKYNIENSIKYVSTSESAVEYINTLLKKITELPESIKKRLIKLVIVGLAVNLTYTQLINVSNKLKPNTKDKFIVSNLINSEIENKKNEIPNNIDTVRSVEPRYMTNHNQRYSDKLIDILKYEEGDPNQKGEPITVAYTIPGGGDGMVTIGYGHAEPIISNNNGVIKSKSMVVGKTMITPEKANELLINDMNENAKYVMHYIINEINKKPNNIEITQPMFDAMVSISFNHGIGNLIKSDFIKELKNGNIKKASELIKNLGNSGEYSKGISARRQMEFELFNGKYPEL